MYLQEEGNGFSRHDFLINTEEYITAFYGEVKKEVTEFLASDNARIEKGEENAKNFVGFVQCISDETATTLRSTMLVPYPVHVIFLNSSAKRRTFLDSEQTLTGFQLVCCF